MVCALVSLGIVGIAPRCRVTGLWGWVSWYTIWRHLVRITYLTPKPHSYELKCSHDAGRRWFVLQGEAMLRNQVRGSAVFQMRHRTSGQEMNEHVDLQEMSKTLRPRNQNEGIAIWSHTTMRGRCQRVRNHIATMHTSTAAHSIETVAIMSPR